ncbi:hypothetical protein KM295_08210 [Natronomonas sp. F2-12]|jgi:hypothetical protein|uniref:Uncharacterized protein n=1 Tax=Natronomonas aquatica TaxID=2841590 RepID=A0A9R1D6I3_9EURY|nr:hypothetical protein [Natronomonas aquatica]MCQ4333463.1 hypothetical protein [Natronomonas aquatica]
MLARKNPEARCRDCGSPLFYGLKPEPTGWKVQYVCPPPEGCGREFVPGRIARSSVGSEDEAYERARKLGQTFK